MFEMKRTFLGSQYRYLFQSFPQRKKLWHRLYFFYELLQLAGKYNALSSALRQPGPSLRTNGKTCVVVLLSHNRPQNLEILVRGALKIPFLPQRGVFARTFR